MSITSTVKNGLIKLPPELNVPDGTEVEITLRDGAGSAPSKEGSIAWMLKYAGTMEGPEDFAAEHDHYIHGTPKLSKQQ